MAEDAVVPLAERGERERVGGGAVEDEKHLAIGLERVAKQRFRRRGRRIVAVTRRAAGVGRAFLSRLCAFLAASRPYQEVWLRVGRDNVPAAACARAAGFEDIPAMSGPRFRWLRKSLEPERASSE